MINLFKTARILYSVFLLLTILLCHNCFADFRFGVIGDSRGDSEKEAINTETLETILTKLKSEQVEFIVFVGDMIFGYGYKDSSAPKKKLLEWQGIIKKYRIPTYIVVGNHEIVSKDSENIIREVFEMPENGPDEFKELVYFFDYKNTHFVIIDTNVDNNLHKLGSKEKLGSTQMKWLDNDLKNARGKIVFVFGHEPAYPVGPHIGRSLDTCPKERNKIWKFFEKYQVDAYFCGHEHLYNKSIHEGVHQIITGGTGAPIPPDITTDKGGFYHFIIVGVKNNGECEITVKDIEKVAKNTFIIKDKHGGR